MCTASRLSSLNHVITPNLQPYKTTQQTQHTHINTHIPTPTYPHPHAYTHRHTQTQTHTHTHARTHRKNSNIDTNSYKHKLTNKLTKRKPHTDTKNNIQWREGERELRLSCVSIIRSGCYGNLFLVF